MLYINLLILQYTCMFFFLLTSALKEFYGKSLKSKSNVDWIELKVSNLINIALIRLMTFCMFVIMEYN